MQPCRICGTGHSCFSEEGEGVEKVLQLLLLVVLLLQIIIVITITMIVILINSQLHFILTMYQKIHYLSPTGI